jgi:hypothetical protein
MRHLLIVLCTVGAACGLTTQATAQTPLEFSLDLLAPCAASGCAPATTHPTDAAFQIQANSFSYAAGSGSTSGAYVATIGLSAPLVCDEIASTGVGGAAGTSRIAPTFTNAAPGGLLEFNAGGTSVVDLGALSYDGSNPAGVTTSYSNYGSPSLPSQVGCYAINPVTGGPAVYASGPYGIFRSGFEDHPGGEPWVSVNTVNSPNATVGSAPLSPKGSTSSVTSANTMAYVVQIHNASSAANWRLSLGYDQAFFDNAANTNPYSAPKWCILGSGIPQPGSTSGTATCNSFTTAYTLKSADVQAATNSIYIYVEYAGSSAATGVGWSNLTNAFYPAVAAVFPPFGTYPQRFDDKVAVASGNNPLTLNVGNIVCANDTSANPCMIYGRDGNLVPAQVNYQNSKNSSGLVHVDPLVYYVSPYSGSTLPSTLDTLSATNVSTVACTDPNGILANPLVPASFGTSNGATGALQLAFAFKASGGLFVPGTAVCTATFASPNHAPALSATHTFTVTMLPATTSHFAVSAPTTATAGTAFNNLTVTALDSGNNTVTSYSGTVHFTSSDTSAALPANATLSGGVGTFSATLKSAGGRTITATDTVTSSITGTSASINVNPAPASHFVVHGQASAMVGASTGLSVTAQDDYFNTDTNYGGTVHFTSTDNVAVLPSDMTLTFGVGTPNVTFNTMGPQTVTATDTVTSSVTGTSNIVTVN